MEKYGLKPLRPDSPPTETWTLVQRLHEQKLGHIFRAKLKERLDKQPKKEVARNDWLSYQPPESP